MREYSPLGEYGDWGIRRGRGGRAYNVKGNRGVRLVLRTGKKVLIGSRYPERLITAIRAGTGRGVRTQP